MYEAYIPNHGWIALAGPTVEDAQAQARSIGAIGIRHAATKMPALSKTDKGAASEYVSLAPRAGNE